MRLKPDLSCSPSDTNSTSAAAPGEEARVRPSPSRPHSTSSPVSEESRLRWEILR